MVSYPYAITQNHSRIICGNPPARYSLRTTDCGKNIQEKYSCLLYTSIQNFAPNLEFSDLTEDGLNKLTDYMLSITDDTGNQSLKNTTCLLYTSVHLHPLLSRPLQILLVC